MELFQKNLNFLLKSTATRQEVLAEFLEMRHTAVSSWKNGKSTPRPDKIDKIAEYFGITPSDLQYSDLTASPMTINIRANKGSNPNVQILDSAKDAIVGYRVHTGHSNEEKLLEENLNLKTRISFLEGQVQLLREMLGK